MRGWELAGILFACALGAGPEAVGQEQIAAAPAPVIDYWVGDMQLAGQVQRDASFSLSGNNLNFDLGRSDPINATARFKVWVPDDGIVRLQIGNCITAMRPAKAGVSLQTGGLFVPDFASVGTAPNCGLAPGEAILQRSDTLALTQSGIQYAYSAVNHVEQPYKGKATIKGQTLLLPVYKPIPKPAPPPRPTVQMASTGAVPGAKMPETGAFLFSDAIKARGIEPSLDAVLQLDSKMWLMNRYDLGSVKNGKFLQQTKGGLSDLIYGEYQFNGGRTGWIKVQLRNGDIDCMEFWDQPNKCRPPGSFSVGTQGLVQAFARDIFSSGSSSSTSSSYDGCENGECDPAKAPPPAYAPPPPPIAPLYGDCHNPTGC